jgi:hypothetical protein
VARERVPAADVVTEARLSSHRPEDWLTAEEIADARRLCSAYCASSALELGRLAFGPGGAGRFLSVLDCDEAPPVPRALTEAEVTAVLAGVVDVRRDAALTRRRAQRDRRAAR